ncbi:MAG: DUF2085 domain-containing protein [Acidobacteria bacterium]|nr:DUF2085 domain-containing protein [Acidobacteriota bacterium]
MPHRWPVVALGRAFTVATVSWGVLLPASSFVASRSHAPLIFYMAAATVYEAGAVLCHQLPARSFHLWSAQLPVCARCTGIYAGAAITSLILMGVARRRESNDRRSPERLPPPLADDLSELRHGSPKRLRREGGPRRLIRLTRRLPRLALLLAAAPTALTLAYESWSGHMPANWIRATAGLPIGAMVTALVVAVTGDQVN